MQIFVKQSPTHLMSKREVAKPQAIAELQRNIKMEENNLKGKRIQDPVQSMRNLKMWKKTMDNVAPRTLTAEEKSFMWKRAKALKDRFTIGMLSQDELHPVRSIHTEKGIQVVVDESKMGNNHSVEHQVKWDKAMGPLVSEFKNIMRQLNPDNPAAGDIERYRPRRSSK